MDVRGILDKMPTLKINPVEYFIHLGDHQIKLNDLIGKEIRLRHTGKIFCTV